MTKCPRCNKNEAVMHPVYGVCHCKECRSKDHKIKEHPRFSTMTMADRIQYQQDKFEKDRLQPWDEKGKPNPEFAKAYPDEAPDYFSKDELESL